MKSALARDYFHFPPGTNYQKFLTILGCSSFGLDPIGVLYLIGLYSIGSVTGTGDYDGNGHYVVFIPETFPQ